MKLVDFQYIQDGVRKLAAVKETLEHLQNGAKEAIAALTDGLLAQGAGVTVLYGCVNSLAHPDYDISAGAVYYGGEIYEVPAFTGASSGGTVPVLSLNTTYLASDPALYRKPDNTSESINTHMIRKLLWSMALPGSGIANHSDAVQLQTRMRTSLAFARQGILEVYTNLNIISNPAVAGETVLYSTVVQPGWLAVDSKSVMKVRVRGAYGSTANGKNIRVQFGGQTLKYVSTTSNGTHWYIDIEAFRLNSTTLRVFSQWGYNGKPELEVLNSQVTVDLSVNKTLEVLGQSGSSAAGDVAVQCINVTIEPYT